MRTRKIKVIEQKNIIVDGRLGYRGAYDERKNKILIDPTIQTPFSYASTLIHEHLHAYFPEASESYVEMVGNKIARALWDKNFRRIMS